MKKRNLLNILILMVVSMVFVVCLQPVRANAASQYDYLYETKQGISSKYYVPGNKKVDAYVNTHNNKKLSYYRQDLNQRVTLVNKLGKVLDNNTSLSSEDRKARKVALGIVNTDTNYANTYSVNNNSVLAAIDNELFKLYDAADTTCIGGGANSYWSAQKMIRYFMGIRGDLAYGKDLTNIPAVRNKANLPAYDFSAFLSSGETVDDIFVIDLGYMLSCCPSQMKLYKQNLNGLFQYIEDGINSGDIKTNSTVTINTKATTNSPIETCNLGSVISGGADSSADDLTKRYNRDWYYAIGHAYGGISAVVTVNSDKSYQVKVNYYLQDYYLWDQNDYDQKGEYNIAASEAMMSILDQTNYICNSSKGGWYFNSNTEYHVGEFKFIGIYNKTWNCKYGSRFTL